MPSEQETVRTERSSVGISYADACKAAAVAFDAVGEYMQNCGLPVAADKQDIAAFARGDLAACMRRLASEIAWLEHQSKHYGYPLGEDRIQFCDRLAAGFDPTASRAAGFDPQEGDK